VAVNVRKRFTFWGFTLYCTCNRKGNFRVGLGTEKSRLRRALMRFQDQMRRMRHSPLREQAGHLNQMLRGHYGYYGIAGNIRHCGKSIVLWSVTGAKC
jgi:RNA-directed DNA polymerase